MRRDVLFQHQGHEGASLRVSEPTGPQQNFVTSSSSRETSALGGDSGTILRGRSLIKRHQQALVALLSSTRLSGLDAVSREMFPVTEELRTSVSPCALLPKTGTGHCSPGSMPGKRR